MAINIESLSIKTIVFYLKGNYRNYHAALDWVINNGYSYGSKDEGEAIALKKGQYDLPQKWRNINDEGKKTVDGIIYSENYREGIVKIFIFK